MHECVPRRQLAPAPAPRWSTEAGIRLPVMALLVGVAYYAGSQVGFALHFPASPISMLWPPNSLLLAAFLLTPVRHWWVLLAGALPAHLAVQIQHDVPLVTMLGLFVTNSGQGLLGAALLRRRFPGPFHLGSLLRVVAFVASAALLAPLVIAFVATALIVGTRYGMDYWLSWRAQFLSNVLTVLTLVPPILALAASRMAWFHRSAARRWAEAALLGIGLMVAVWLVFWPEPFSVARFPALLYAPLPLLLWAALRFGTGGVSLAALVVAACAVIYAVGVPGPFGGLSPFENVVSLQLYLIAAIVPLLALAA